MATTKFKQSDYESNVNQTDGRLHISSGGETLQTTEQSLNPFESKIVLSEILIEMRILNKYMAMIVGDTITENQS